MTNPTKAPSRRDLRLHAAVCALPADGRSWTDRCRCMHMRVRHADAEHAQIWEGRRLACSGRNNAGRCLDCPCPRFTEPEETTR